MANHFIDCTPDLYYERSRRIDMERQLSIFQSNQQQQLQEWKQHQMQQHSEQKHLIESLENSLRNKDFQVDSLLSQLSSLKVKDQGIAEQQFKRMMTESQNAQSETLLLEERIRNEKLEKQLAEHQEKHRAMQQASG